MSDCVSCNTPPDPCNCGPHQTCVQTPRNCTTCPQNVCISSSSASSSPDQNKSSSVNMGGTIGGAVGGTAAGLIFVTIIYLMLKRRPSSKGNKNGFKNGKQSPNSNNILLNLIRSLNPFSSNRPSNHNSNLSNEQLNRRMSFKELSKNGMGKTQSTIYLPKTLNQSSPSIENSPTTSSTFKQFNQPNSGTTSSHQINNDAKLSKRLSAHLMDVLDPEMIKFISTPSTTGTDDPFSDHKNVSPSLSPQTILTTQVDPHDRPSTGFSTSSRLSSQNLIPIAYIPPNSKSLSIGDVEDRDGLGNSSPSPTGTMSSHPHLRHNQHQPADNRPPSSQMIEVIDHVPSPSAGSAHRSSFLASPLPINPASNSGHAKPIRPPRAPDLDLRLPPPAASSTSASSSPQNTKSNHRLSDPDSRRPNGASNRLSVDSSVAATVAAEGAAAPDRWTRPASLSIPVSPLFGKASHGSTDGMPSGARLSLDSSNSSALLPPSSTRFKDRSTRTISNASGSTHDSHLSSILDPAMIVTPVTIVRTASGRQAAVQRVALRGQEKARVVRLGNNNNKRPGTGNSVSALTAAGNEVANPSEDLPVPSPLTPGVGRSDEEQTRLSAVSATGTVGYLAPKDGTDFTSDQPSPSTLTVGSFELEGLIGEASGRGGDERKGMAVENPFEDRAAVEIVSDNDREATPPSSSSEQDQAPRTISQYSTDVAVGGAGGGGGGVGVGNGARVDPSQVRSYASNASSDKRKTGRSSFGTGSSFDGSIIEEGDIQFGTVLGRSTFENHEYNPQHLPLRSLGRDMTISLSSMIDQEFYQDETSEVPPIPEPYKPFAGQRPSSRRSTHGSHTNGGGLSSSERNDGVTSNNSGSSSNVLNVQNVQNPEPVRQQQQGRKSGEENGSGRMTSNHNSLLVEDENSRLSTASSLVSDSCGSVLEGIPFNIRFNSENDDELFGLDK